MAQTKKKKTASQDYYAHSLGETADTSSKPMRTNGVKSAPKAAAANSSSSSGKEKAAKKSSKNKSSSKNDASSSKKKQKRRSDKDSATASSPPAKKKKEHKPEPPGSSRASSYMGTDDDSSDEEDSSYSPRENLQMPEVGEEVAILCPPDPPYPEGWYTGVVINVTVAGDDGPKSSNSKVGPKSKKGKVKNFTVHIEWDGGGEEALLNPEWRMKGDAPDKQGRVSHRDAKLRPYFKYWVNRLNHMSEAEKKLSKSRAGKNTRVDPGQKVEWIRCSSPSCGKWRPLPPYMKSSAILETCNSEWYCVLNSWDEAVASCGAPQETGYMPTK